MSQQLVPRLFCFRRQTRTSDPRGNLTPGLNLGKKKNLIVYLVDIFYGGVDTVGWTKKISIAL